MLQYKSKYTIKKIVTLYEILVHACKYEVVYLAFIFSKIFNFNLLHSK